METIQVVGLTMMRTKRLEKSISILGCVLVFAFLLAPKLIVHRHADLADHLGSASVLERHVERFHADDHTPIDPSELHVHWTFSIQPSEQPTHSTSERCLGGSSVAGDSESLATYLSCGTTPHHAHDRIDRSETLHATLDTRATLFAFKRVLFGVWNI
jgi:hypothetical protein